MLSNFQNDPLAKFALIKMGAVPEGFLIYRFSWLGEDDLAVMEVTGAVFREAKSGPRKGQQCIKVKGTEKSCYLTTDEVRKLNLK